MLAGETHDEAGREVVVVTRTAPQGWAVAWRAQLALPVASS